MTFIYALITVIHVCFAVEMTTPFDWKNRDFTTEKVVFFPNLDKIMVERGERISKQMTTSSGDFDEYNGKALIEDIFRYNICVEDAIEFMSSKNVQEKEAGLRVYNGILKEGGPQHLKITVDLDLITKKFPDLKKDDIAAISTSFIELKMLWTKWQEVAANLKN